MIEATEGETMKDRIDAYIKKKKREAALKILKDNLPLILGILGVFIALIVLGILKKRAKKKVKAKIKESIRNRRHPDDFDDEESEDEF